MLARTEELTQGCPTDRIEDVLALRNAMRELSAEDRHLLYRRYYHEETQSTIAGALGMSRMQVSRRLSRILGDLQARLLDGMGAGGAGIPPRRSNLGDGISPRTRQP
ncbi:DNA-directed RNA polymerase specialized sigma subunit [Paenarthrobacter sp. A20]|nr:DNA-directed RNA polymerase specialized sigma subunit [Paenarthrobacter sp. A20]